MVSKIVTDRALIVNLVYNFQSISKVVVFVHGVFELIHPGHIAFLKSARNMGDILIVGVYDDKTVESIKGPARPVSSLEERMNVLSALSDTSYIIPLAFPQNEEIIAQLRPNIVVQGEGNEYPLDTSSLGKYQGTLKTVKLYEHYSVTALIHEIKNLPLAHEL